MKYMSSDERDFNSNYKLWKLYFNYFGSWTLFIWFHHCFFPPPQHPPFFFYGAFAFNFIPAVPFLSLKSVFYFNGLPSYYLFMASLASSVNPCSTLMLFLALVSKNIMFPFSLQYYSAACVVTRRYPSSARSTLFPNTKNGGWYECSY